MEKENLTLSGLARAAGVRPSFVSQLINDRRIPEARRSEEDGKYRIPNRRCVIPAKYPKPNAKIDRFYFRPEEIPRSWIDDPASRPGTLGENGDFVGVELEGDESEPLAERISRTFGVEVGRAAGGNGQEADGAQDAGEKAPREGIRALQGWKNKPVLVTVRNPDLGAFPGKFLEADGLGVVVWAPPSRAAKEAVERGTISLEPHEGRPRSVDAPEDDGRPNPPPSVSQFFFPWSSVEHLEKPDV